jgi:hypothetical protein
MSAQYRSTQLFDGQESFSNSIASAFLEESRCSITRQRRSIPLLERGEPRTTPTHMRAYNSNAPRFVNLRVASTDSPSEV